MNIGFILSPRCITWRFNAQGIAISNHILGFKNYRHGDKNRRSGGHGGRVNASWELGNSRPKLGLSWMNGEFGILMVELCSALSLGSLCDVWHASMPGKVCSPYGFATLFTFCFGWRIGILVTFFFPFLQVEWISLPRSWVF